MTTNKRGEKENRERKLIKIGYRWKDVMMRGEKKEEEDEFLFFPQPMKEMGNRGWMLSKELVM